MVDKLTILNNTRKHWIKLKQSKFLGKHYNSIFSLANLEDFLELAEDLPSEVADKLNKIKLLDEKAEHLKSKCLKKKKKVFTSMKMKEGDENDHQKALDGINKDFMKIVEMHKKKKEIADNMENLISRYERKLDSDILKCKRELEEENPGVTEVIENRVNNPKTPPLQQAPKKRPSKKPRGKNRFSVEIKQEVEQPERQAKNEEKFCKCNQVSYGNMIACDAEGCPIQWFHYGCVGISEAPTGEWFCPDCRVGKLDDTIKEENHLD